jgi:hypothetical protein
VANENENGIDLMPMLNTQAVGRASRGPVAETACHVIDVPLEMTPEELRRRKRHMFTVLYGDDIVLLPPTRWTREVKLSVDNCGVYFRFFQEGWFIASFGFRFPGLNPYQKRFEFFAWNLDFDADKRAGLFEVDFEVTDLEWM